MGTKKVSFHTLGCKLNFSETSTLARQFAGEGFDRAAKGEKADICVVNTCSVTGHADKKCRNMIRRIARENPGALIAVTGCYAQLRPDDVASIEGVDIVVGNDGKGELVRRVAGLAGRDGGSPVVCGCESWQVAGFFASFSSGDRTRAFLKVQDGCDYRCSYCTIPDARGPSRNIPVEELAAQAREIAAAGQREIVITGINTGDFGHSTGESFADLLRALGGTDGIERFRISSIEPNLLTDEIIALTAAHPKFMPHFHIPLQSGCDTVLARMRRRYTTGLFAERVAALRRAMPDAFIGIDVITGFPGESDEEFEQTYRFLEELAPAFLHIFPYSARPGTPAADFVGQVPPQVSEARAARLKELCERLHRGFAERHGGAEADVLFESTERGGRMTGFTDNYIKVSAPYDRTRISRICRVRLGETGPDATVEGAVSEP